MSDLTAYIVLYNYVRSGPTLPLVTPLYGGEVCGFTKNSKNQLLILQTSFENVLLVLLYLHTKLYVRSFRVTMEK